MFIWLVLFFTAFPFAVYRAFREPIWAAMIAGYFYYAIPQYEFRLPGAPYQAAFWMFAVFTSWRYQTLRQRWARDELDRTARAIGRETTAAMEAPLVEALLSGALEGKSEEALADSVSRSIEGKALDLLTETAPELLVAPVSAAIGAVIEGAASAGAAVAVAARTSAKATSDNIGVLRAALEARIPEAVHTSLEENLDKTIHEMVERLIEEDERVSSGRRTSDRGALDVPVERGPLAAVLTNTGIWLHLAFVLLTYLGAKAARYDVDVAMARVAVAALLFVPMLGIVTGVRSVRHWRFFVWAWMCGVAHLCMNGINIWVRYGGRADMVGGQGNDANFLGAITVVVAPVALSMAIREKTTLLRLVGLGFAGIYVLGILACGSRGALLALLAGMAYWLVHVDRKLLAFSIAAVGLACFLVVAPESFWERMGTMLLPKDSNPWIVQTYEPSAHERVLLWDLAIQVYKDNFWMGIGPQQFTIESASLPIVDAYAGMRGMMTHNSWLQIASEYGTFGLIVWVGNFVLPLFMYRRARARLKPYQDYAWFPAYCVGLEAGIIGSAVAITFSSFQWLDYIYWTFVFGPLSLQVAHDTAARLDWYYEPHSEVRNEVRPKKKVRDPSVHEDPLPAAPEEEEEPVWSGVAHEDPSVPMDIEEVTHFVDDPSELPKGFPFRFGGKKEKKEKTGAKWVVRPPEPKPEGPTRIAPPPTSRKDGKEGTGVKVTGVKVSDPAGPKITPSKPPPKPPRDPADFADEDTLGVNPSDVDTMGARPSVRDEPPAERTVVHRPEVTVAAGKPVPKPPEKKAPEKEERTEIKRAPESRDPRKHR